ncbi:hypothetical protein Peur_023799 [Populus x canadensis]
MEARVSDLGLATLMEPNKTHVSTLVAGTSGYLAPDEEFFEEGTKLVTWVKAVVEDKREVYVLESSLKCSPTEEINKVFRIAFMCLPEPSKRPTMDEIVKMLEQAKSERVVEEY